MFGELGEDARRGAALAAITTLSKEYSVEIVDVEQVLLDVMLDLADEANAGARGLYHAAHDLFAEALADIAGDRDGAAWSIVAGPPPTLVPAS